MKPVIDLAVFEQVRCASPMVQRTERDEIRAMLDILTELSVGENAERSLDGMMFWRAYVKELVALLRDGGIETTPRKAGPMLAGLGLVSYRKNDGTVIAWSEAQLDILLEHFGM